MKYLFNSAVIPAGGFGKYEYFPATISDLKRFVKDSAHSYIGYEQNLDFIERVSGVRPAYCRGVAHLNPGDEAFVMRIKHRIPPDRKGELIEEDFEFGILKRLK